MIGYVDEDMIRLQMSGSEEAYDTERMLRAVEAFCRLNESAWRRSLKARKQAVHVMRATTEIVVRKLIRNVIERGNWNAEDTTN